MNPTAVLKSESIEIKMAITTFDAGKHISDPEQDKWFSARSMGETLAMDPQQVTSVASLFDSKAEQNPKP